MSGRKLLDQDRVLELIRANPGLPEILLAWMSAGGEVARDGAKGTVEMTFSQFVKIHSTGKRVTDLVKRGRVKRGVALVATRTATTGYYPAEWVASKPARVPSQEPIVPRSDASKATAIRGIGALKAALDDE